MFGFLKSKPLRDEFYEQHKLTPEWEQYLNVGAMLIETNQRRDSLTLQSRWPSKHLVPLLNSAWNISNNADTNELVEELITLPVLKKQALIPSEQLMNEELFDSIERNCGRTFAKSSLYFSKKYFDGVKDLAAWDIERAGLVVRYAFNTGWLTKEETLDYLKAFHKLVKQHYTTWLDYYLGYLKGRTVMYDTSVSDAFNYIFTLETFYKKEGYLSTVYPL